MKPPINIQVIGTELAIAWADGAEDYFSAKLLRSESPSADNKGEQDIFGNTYGGNTGEEDFSDVSIDGWQYVGNYAIRIDFSDGHKTGLFSWEYLQSLREKQK
jgi:DUF971 family protein